MAFECTKNTFLCKIVQPTLVTKLARILEQNMVMCWLPMIIFLINVTIKYLNIFKQKLGVCSIKKTWFSRHVPFQSIVHALFSVIEVC